MYTHFRSLGGVDPVKDVGFDRLIEALGINYPRVYRSSGSWQNVTICTLYRSCGEITEYKHANTTCDECKVTYNHCPWIPTVARSLGVTNMLTVYKFSEFTICFWIVSQIFNLFH